MDVQYAEVVGSVQQLRDVVVADAQFSTIDVPQQNRQLFTAHVLQVHAVLVVLVHRIRKHGPRNKLSGDTSFFSSFILLLMLFTNGFTILLGTYVDEVSLPHGS